jgi:hypothetical protein
MLLFFICVSSLAKLHTMARKNNSKHFDVGTVGGVNIDVMAALPAGKLVLVAFAGGWDSSVIHFLP